MLHFVTLASPSLTFSPKGRLISEKCLHHLKEVSEGAGLAEIYSEMIRIIWNWIIIWRIWDYGFKPLMSYFVTLASPSLPFSPKGRLTWEKWRRVLCTTWKHFHSTAEIPISHSLWVKCIYELSSWLFRGLQTDLRHLHGQTWPKTTPIWASSLNVTFCHTCCARSGFQPEGPPEMREMEESALHHLEEVSEGAGLAEIYSEMIRIIWNWIIMWRIWDYGLKPLMSYVGTGGKPSTWFPPGDS